MFMTNVVRVPSCIGKNVISIVTRGTPFPTTRGSSKYICIGAKSSFPLFMQSTTYVIVKGSMNAVSDSICVSNHI